MRTLVKTPTSGWFIEVTDDGASDKKVRKQDDDQIYDSVAEATEARAALKAIGTIVDPPAPEASDEHDMAVKSGHAPNGNRGTEAAKQAVRERQVQTTIAPTGKVLKGKTIEITCSEPGCKEKRVIKPQDRFQVTRCVGHQAEHRKKVRREKQRARTARRRQEREAATA